MSATSDLKKDHIIVRRLGTIVQKCSDKLYGNKDIPLEDIETISVIIEEFVDRFHHGKEEQAYFPETKSKDNFREDIPLHFMPENIISLDLLNSIVV